MVAPPGPSGRIGVYPGSFDPATIAHVHLATLAVEYFRLDRLDFAISATTLGKIDTDLGSVETRIAELNAATADNPALAIVATEQSLLADIATGYDVVVLGADKWHQILDPAWYGGVAGRDAALRRLPVIALAPRPPWTMPDDDPSVAPPPGVEIVVLQTDPAHREVSATGVRAGRHEWRALPPGTSGIPS